MAGMMGDRDLFSSAADQDEECVNEFWIEEDND